MNCARRAAFIALIAVGLGGCATNESADVASASTPAASGAVSDVEILYGYRCKGCHEPATPGAPSREKLATWKPQKVLRALTSGEMEMFAVGLTQQQMRDLAAFLAAPPRVSQAK